MRKLLGALAQLGEHLLCKQGVIGSIPIRSTNVLFCGAKHDGRRFSLVLSGRRLRAIAESGRAQCGRQVALQLNRVLLPGIWLCQTPASTRIQLASQLNVGR